MTQEHQDQGQGNDEAVVAGITLDRTFTAPPAAVFRALSTPEGFSRWFGGPMVQVPLESLDFVAEAGREWRAVMVLPDGNTIDWVGDVLAVDPEVSLVLTITDRPDESARAELSFDLSPTADGGTELFFAQETPGFTPEQQEATAAGWGGFLDELAVVASEG